MQSMLYLPINGILVELITSRLLWRIDSSTINTIDNLLSPKVIAPIYMLAIYHVYFIKRTYVMVSVPPANNSKSISSPLSAIRMTAVTAPGTLADLIEALKLPYFI
jgi:hypothetical protein